MSLYTFPSSVTDIFRNAAIALSISAENFSSKVEKADVDRVFHE